MQGLRNQMLCAICAITVGFCLSGAGQQRKWDEAAVMLREAFDDLAVRQTPQAFSYHYDRILIKDTLRALDLAASWWWLIEDPELLSEIYAKGINLGGAGPLRGGAVDRLTITKITRGLDAFHLKLEWPTSGPNKTEFPTGAVDIMFNLGFNPVYWAPILWDVQVNPLLGEKLVEVPYSAFHLHAGGVPPAVGFFRVRPSYPHEGGDVYMRDNWDWDDDGQAAFMIPPLDERTPWTGVFLDAAYDDWGNRLATNRTVTVSVEPGKLYLVLVTCIDGEMLAPAMGFPSGNTLFSWDITGEGIETPFAGNVNTVAHKLVTPVHSDTYFLEDIRFVSIPTNAPPNASVQVKLAMTPDAAPIYLGAVFMYAQFIPLNVYQSNLPKSALQSPPGSTDNMGYTSKYLPEGGMAFITGEPKAPKLGAHFTSVFSFNSLGVSVEWRMTVETERPDYRTNSTMRLDDRLYPTNGTWYARSNPQESSLDITPDLMGNEIIGGKCALYCKATGVNGMIVSNRVNFLIRGMNPTDLDVTNYIHNLVCASPTLGPTYSKLARKTAQHESKQTNKTTGQSTAFNQYNSGGSTIWLPNKTDDTKDKKGNPVKQWGWGIFQDDEGPFTNGAPRWVTTASVYNWPENVRRGVAKLEKKLADHNRFMGYFQQDYETLPPLDMPYLVGGYQFTVEQFGTVVLFNGADEEYIPRSEVWTGEYEADGITRKIKAFWSPVAYNVNSNGIWTYHDNRNDYAKQIGKEMMSNWIPKE